MAKLAPMQPTVQADASTQQPTDAEVVPQTTPATMPAKPRFDNGRCSTSFLKSVLDKLSKQERKGLANAIGAYHGPRCPFFCTACALRGLSKDELLYDLRRIKWSGLVDAEQADFRAPPVWSQRRRALLGTKLLRDRSVSGQQPQSAFQVSQPA